MNKQCIICGVPMIGVSNRTKYCEPHRLEAQQQSKKRSNEAAKKAKEMVKLGLDPPPKKYHQRKRIRKPDRLSEMMAYFRRHGYNTYGKGRAAMENGLIPMFDDQCVSIPHQEEFEDLLVCPICGVAFPRYRTRIYCSQECQLESNRRKSRIITKARYYQKKELIEDEAECPAPEAGGEVQEGV